MATDLVFEDKHGESNLIKEPGSINGESFILRNLHDCRIFLADYTSEVEVTNCTNCQIFIGPVDGPAIFENCNNCQVAVACRMLKANDCHNISFALYCANGPSISSSDGVKISCFAGAYAGLTAHFAAANLDPNKNQWNKVYDANATPDDQGPANFELSYEPSPVWEVPLNNTDGGSPENPVPAPDGSLYNPLYQTAAPVLPDLSEPADAEVDPFASSSSIQENGNHAPSDLAAAGYEMTPPATSAARDKVQQRLVQQATEEAKKKAELQTSAAAFLEDFYAKKEVQKLERIKQLQQQSTNTADVENGPRGASDWERVVSMIDFNVNRPSGTDLTRYKAVLFSCKGQAA